MPASLPIGTPCSCAGQCGKHDGPCERKRGELYRYVSWKPGVMRAAEVHATRHGPLCTRCRQWWPKDEKASGQAELFGGAK